MSKVQIINGSLSEAIFSKAYPVLNKFLMDNGDTVPSRNGVTKEILNFKTEITNPYYRCVGGNERDINIFFLLAEAMWIFTGRKDVAFLEIFNSNMAQFSDDGKSFHAPYGFRLRHWGVNSFDTYGEENKHAAQGKDQIEAIIRMLGKNPEDRRIIAQIWNPDFDLEKDSKDLPCNDTVMLISRNGKLHTTIENRSNDLHWGLPTNIFQFGFISEIIANIVNLELGTQVHNSRSLHIYTENKIAWKMYENFSYNNSKDLYDVSIPMKMSFNFSTADLAGRLKLVDLYLNNIIENLTNESYPEDFDTDLLNFSPYLSLSYDLLRIYRKYKATNKTDEVRRDIMQQVALHSLSNQNKTIDLSYLAMNFFASRLNDKNGIVGALGKL